jgi:dTDP-4-dehydrorhamnose reductase
MRKLLVTGVSGFLGWHVANFRQRSWKVVGVFNSTAYSSGRHLSYCVDFDQTDQLYELLREVRPDGIMHLAAVSSPKACAENINQSYRTNVVVPTLLAEYASEQNIPFVFSSSDMVFSGHSGPYGPYDYTNPINVYGKQKAEAEERILDIYREATIARLPLLYGIAPYGTNFLSSWLETWTQGKVLHAFSDEIRSVISGSDAARGLFLLLNKQLQHIWHLGGKEPVSRLEFARMLAKSFGFDESLVVPSTISEAGLAGKRPADLTLDSRMTYEHGFDPLPVKKSLKSLQKLAF